MVTYLRCSNEEEVHVSNLVQRIELIGQKERQECVPLVNARLHKVVLKQVVLLFV
jgi:hypothetical protein